MKLHNNNSDSLIITSNDVLVDGKNPDILTNIIDGQEDKISNLEKNVKWLYKYGGTGSKGSGSGSGSTEFKVNSTVLFGNTYIKKINENQIIIVSNSKTNETLSISVNGNPMHLYDVLITKDGNKKTYQLTQENDYALSLNIQLNDSGNFSIRVRGISGITGEQDSFTYNFTYISNPYKISLSLINNNGINILNSGNLYVNDALQNNVSNVKLKIDYEITTTSAITYRILNSNNIFESNEDYVEGVINQNGSGLGDVIIPFKLDFLNNSNNYGSYVINVKFDIPADPSLGILTPQILSKDIAFTYIPNDIQFFKIEPFNSNARIYKYNDANYNNAKELYNQYNSLFTWFKTLDSGKDLSLEDKNECIELLNITDTSISNVQLKELINNKLDEIESELYMFNPGALQLYVQAFYGSDTISSINDVIVKIDYENMEENNLIEVGTLKYRVRKLTNIPVHNLGVHKLCIYQKNNNSNPIWYYFAIFDKNQGINWFSSDVEFNGIDLYYNAGNIGTHILNHSDNYLDPIKKYKNVQLIQKFSNDTISELFNLNVNSLISETECDIMLSFGIQYSHINNDNKILTILTNNESSNLNLDIYQNKIIGANKTGDPLVNIFIPKEHSYSPINKYNYHLLTIYKRFIYHNSTPYYEIIIYIDGCQEGAFKSFTNDSTPWASVKLNNANYSINFFEVAYFTHNNSKNESRFNKTNGVITTNKITYLDDIAISEYYYKYISERTNLSNIESLLNNLRNFKETNYGMIECASYEDINAIATNLDIPVLLLDFTEKSEYEFVNWFTKSYNEGELVKDKKKLDIIYYSPGKQQLTAINIPTELGQSYWYMALQGSSTGTFFDKNLTLGINSDSEVQNGRLGIFTPNFYDIDSINQNLTQEEKTKEELTAKNSFLPETSFTLKADVVDSTHSNNTAVGAFVNQNTTKFDINFGNSTTNNKYINYIKNCLLGFPVLVFSKINNTNNETNFYFLGIYNFNLGRDSYFNMGYYNPNIFISNSQQHLQAALNGAQGKSFIVSWIEYTPTQEITVDDGVIVAEIQGGDPHFDFSQYHETILFPQIISDDKEDTECMFGDFVPKYDPSSSTNANLRIRYHLQRLVKGISLAGGYLFETVLKKHLGEQQYLYNRYVENGLSTSIYESANQVPNYKLQYRRSPQEADDDLKYLINNFVKDGENYVLINDQPYINEDLYKGTNKDLIELIDINATEETANQYTRGITPILNYTSLTEYYTTCMGFGLVDSVMKNLNVKSWDAIYTNDPERNKKTGQWFVAFYDMDTSFGRDNAGKKTSYFAFSDYWKTNKSGNLEQPTVYKDFYPKSNEALGQSINEPGFDIPSSYLFAVAKYSHLYSTEILDTNSIPNNIWARWRNVSSSNGGINGPGKGELRNADYFINKYFIRNLDNIPQQLWALNYRLKYLKRITQTSSDSQYYYTYDTSLNGSFNDRNFTPFHGKGINELREWLSGRFHILDTYFNLEGWNSMAIKYLDYEENTNPNVVNKFTPIVKLGTLKGYKYNDTMIPKKDNDGNFMWINIPGGTGPMVETSPAIDSNILKDNLDIEVLQDIFGGTAGTNVTYSQPVDLYIKAKELSPLYIYTPIRQYKYLLEDPTIEYHLTYNPTGVQVVSFGGSTLWTYVRNLNTVINANNTLSINSGNLEQVVLTKGKCDSFDLSSLKSLKTVHIEKALYDNDTSFSGNLVFNISNTGENPHPDLNVIELIRTEITLNVNQMGVSKIDLTGTHSSSPVSILNCANLTSVNLSNFSTPQLEILPGWSNNMIISNSKVKEMILSSKNTDDEERSICIQNDSALEKITLSGFTHIKLENCAQLYNIIITNPLDIVSLEIINCNQVVNRNLKLNSISENTEGKIDLSTFTNIKTFKFTGTKGFTTIDCSNSIGEKITINDTIYNIIRLYPQAFANTKLNTILLSDNTYLYIDGGEHGTTATFENSEYSGYLSTNSNAIRMIIGKNVTKLDNMFSHVTLSNIKANVYFSFVSKFLRGENDVIYEDINNITSLGSLFYGQTNISTSINNVDQISGLLSNFKNVNNINKLFFGTSMGAFNKTIFGSDDDYCGKNVIDNNQEFNLACFIPTVAQIYTDLFDYYINNITTLISDYENISYNFKVLGLTNNELDIIEFFDKFDINNNILDSFIGFNIDNNHKVNWANLLYVNGELRFKHLKTIYNSFNNQNDDSKGYDNIGLQHISTLNTFENSFNFSNKSNERYTITELIDFENLPASYVLPHTNNNLGGARKVEESDIIKILQALHNANCKNISNLFSYTNIIVDTSKENINELRLHINNNEYTSYVFKTCSSLFENSKFIDSENNVYGYEITQNTLKYFNNVKNWSRAFANTTLHKNLPLNMFNLKEEEEDYEVNNYNSVIEDLTSMFENVKIDSSETYFNHENFNITNIATYNNDIPLNGSYHESIMVATGLTLTNAQSKNIKLDENNKNIYGEDIVNHLILPWDIFYGCQHYCNINNFIKNSDFEGILPAKLFTGKINQLNINGVFENVLVVPNYICNYVIKDGDYYTECKAYSFIPTNFTKSNYLQNAFNFKLILPQSKRIINLPSYEGNSYYKNNNDEIELYFIFNMGAIDINNLETIQTALPQDYIKTTINDNEYTYRALHIIDYTYGGNSNNNYLFNVRDNYAIHLYMYNSESLYNYHVTESHYQETNDTWYSYSIENIKTINNEETGLPLGNNVKLLYKTIFTDSIISYCYGAILNKIDLSSIPQISDSNYIISLNEDWSDISKNIILPENGSLNNAYYYEKGIIATKTYNKVKHISSTNVMKGDITHYLKENSIVEDNN